MKKSTLLSLLTAGAVIATSAGTFAAWDETTKTVSTNLTIDKPVTVEVKGLSLAKDAREIGAPENPTYKGQVTVNAKNLPTDITKTDYEIVYAAKAYEEGDTNKAKIAGINASAVETAPAATLDAQHTVDVTVETTDEAKTFVNAGNQLTVEVTATLQKKASSN